MTDQPPVHFFVHVPKCAGRTIELHLEQHIGPRYIHTRRRKAPGRWFAPSAFREPAGVDMAAVRAVSGHPLGASMATRFPGREIRQAVLLRHPVGMMVSFHNFRMMIFRREGWPEVGFERFCRSRHVNPAATFLLSYYFEQPWSRIVAMTRQDKFDFISERLDRFWFVGDYRNCDDLIATVSRDLGIPGVADRANVLEKKVTREEDLAPATVDRLLEENALDLKLWETWKDRRFATATPAPAPVPIPDRRMATFTHEIGRLVENQRLQLSHGRHGGT